jgi:hypothetical protein
MQADPRSGAGGDAIAPWHPNDRLREPTADNSNLTQGSSIYQPEAVRMAQRWVSKHRVTLNAAIVLAALALRCRHD